MLSSPEEHIGAGLSSSLLDPRTLWPGGAETLLGSRFRTWIPKEQEIPGSAADLHRPLCLLLPHREQGAAEEPHGPSLDSPSTDCPSTLTTARGHIPLPAQHPSMEVTTVSPSPSSPTEGDNLCETDVTSMAIHSVTLLICLCGLAGNGAVLCLLGFRCSSRNSTILYIHIRTFFDFLFLLLLLPSTLLFLLENVSCSIIMPLGYVGFLFRVSLLSYSFWLYTLTIISIKRCRSIHCPLWLCCHRPQHLSWVVLALLGAFFITLITIFAVMLSLCMFQISEYCWVSLISMYTFNLLLSAPFMLISSIILFIKVKPGSHQQQPKRFDIVICLIVLFTLPRSLCNFLQELGYTIMPSQAVFLLACISSSINPFIYFLVGRCRRPCSMQSLRLSLRRIFEEPEENIAHRDDPAMEAVL